MYKCISECQDHIQEQRYNMSQGLFTQDMWIFFNLIFSFQPLHPLKLWKSSINDDGDDYDELQEIVHYHISIIFYLGKRYMFFHEWEASLSQEVMISPK